MGDGGRRDHQPGRRRGAAIPADRAAVVGVRQLRDALQGLRPEGRAARSRTRRSPTPPRSTAFTGVAPTVALHIPWDKVDDYADLARHAADAGVALGTINSNVFQDDDYMLGSVCNPDARVRRKALDHLLACIDIMDATGSRDLKLWFSDGTNYPGQDDIRARQDRLAEALAAVHARLGADQRMLLEYKFFEPSFYTMDVPGLGDGVHPVRRGRAQGEGRRRHRPPRAGHQHRVHRRVAAARRPPRRLRLQLALLRRRRPDGRLGRPVPAVPDHARGRPGRARWTRRWAWRSCSTSATTSSPRSRARSGR